MGKRRFHACLKATGDAGHPVARVGLYYFGLVLTSAKTFRYAGISRRRHHRKFDSDANQCGDEDCESYRARADSSAGAGGARTGRRSSVAVNSSAASRCWRSRSTSRYELANGGGGACLAVTVRRRAISPILLVGGRSIAVLCMTKRASFVGVREPRRRRVEGPPQMLSDDGWHELISDDGRNGERPCRLRRASSIVRCRTLRRF